MSDSVNIPDLSWPESLTVSSAKRLARDIKLAAGIPHSHALHLIARRYGFADWRTALEGISDDRDRAERHGRKMRQQQRRATKWAAGNAERREKTDAMARQSPGWVGRASALADVDPGMRPVDQTTATTVYHPRRMD